MEIGKWAFEGCDKLCKVYSKIEDPSKCDVKTLERPSKDGCKCRDHVFGTEVFYKQATLVVPNIKGIVSAYKKKAAWKKFSAIIMEDLVMEIVVPKRSKVIKKKAFFENKELASAVIPDSIKVIRNGCFYYSGLTSIVWPQSLETIEGGAFYSCKFTSLAIPETVTKMGKEAFMNCKNLEDITLPK